MRQSGERLKQAADRIAQLEGMVQESQLAAPGGRSPVSDDTLQRTLLLAQKFVDQTQAEAEAQARVHVAEAEDRARKVLRDAEQRAKSLTEDTERHLREEIARLESIRTQLAGDVETIARHMENERNRLRGALERHAHLGRRARPAGRVDPGAAVRRRVPTARPSDDVPTMSAPPRPGEEIPTVAAPDSVGGMPGHEPSAMTLEGGGRRRCRCRETPPPVARSSIDAETSKGDSDHQGVMAIDENSQPQAIAPR